MCANNFKSLFMGGCGSVPLEEQWVGLWESAEAYVIISPNGKWAWKGEGGNFTGYVVEYGELDRDTKYVKVGGVCFGCCNSKQYTIQKEPVEEAGNWKQQAASKQFKTETKWRMIVNRYTFVKKEDK